MPQRWGKENMICGDDIEATQHIGRQSPDIAQGVKTGGFGDQGVMFGMATNTPETDYKPKDWWLARKIGKLLYDTRHAGLDIKTQVTMKDDRIDEIVVAIPHTREISSSNHEVSIIATSLPLTDQVTGSTRQTSSSKENKSESLWGN